MCVAELIDKTSDFICAHIVLLISSVSQLHKVMLVLAEFLNVAMIRFCYPCFPKMTYKFEKWCTKFESVLCWSVKTLNFASCLCVRLRTVTRFVFETEYQTIEWIELPLIALHTAMHSYRAKAIKIGLYLGFSLVSLSSVLFVSLFFISLFFM